MKFRKKEYQVDRRSFLQKASLLLSSVGVGSLMRTELLDKLARQIIPQAYALDPNAPSHVMELCFRSGVPFMPIATSTEFLAATNRQYPNSPFTQNDLSSVAGGRMAMPNGSPLIKYADRMAVTQNVTSQGSGHTSRFLLRGQNKGASPIVMHADRYANASSGVAGVNFQRGGVDNLLDGSDGKRYTDLIDVGGRNDFLDLFKKPRLRLTDQEVQLVTQTVTSLSRHQASVLEGKINNAQLVVQDQQKSFDLLTEDNSQSINDEVNTITDTRFRLGNQGQPSNWNQNLGENMALAAVAMGKGLLMDATFSCRTGDWHGRRDVAANSYQNQYGQYMADILTATLDYLAATPDPTAPGKTLLDTTMILCTSEFTRGTTLQGNDNSDGGTQGFLAIGPNVSPGFYGATELGNGNVRHYGFDPMTGASVLGQGRNSTDEAYNTILTMMGLSDKKVSAQTLLTMIK